MWRLKQLIPKDQGSLEGKTVEVQTMKLQLRSTIAQGGFSCVYLARDAATGRQYAVKHIICNDLESLDLVKNEVTVMKALRGHPNVVALHAQAFYDMGRTKECLLVMDYCEKMLANVLENRGAGYFDEKQILLIFRDVCNAVYAMHCQSPPIAHRDLKAENVLMGSDGLWKLCDFGSTSTNHKRFEKPDEMGIEEDTIRKHTTPAYRAPEMWDLFRRELISEKVDIWALGCLLFKIAYLKSAFDGESKLQILNGNYRIPDAPRYSTVVTDLIRDMLTASPDTRPDVMQVWRRVNDALPSDARKQHPEKPPSSPAGREPSETRAPTHAKASAVPSRSPPIPPVQKDAERRSVQNGTSGSVGAFWTTRYAQDVRQDGSPVSEKTGGADSPGVRPISPGSRSRREEPSPPEKTSSSGHFLKKGAVSNLIKKVQGRSRDDHEHNGYEMRLDSDGQTQADADQVKGYATLSASPVSRAKPTPSSDPAFNEFAAHFEKSTIPEVAADTSGKSQQLQAELDRLNKELQQALADKASVSNKYEKLTAICRSQQQEIMGLKNALSTANSLTISPGKGHISPKNLHNMQSQAQPMAPKGWQAFDQQPREKQSGTIWDLQEGLSPVGSTSQRITSVSKDGSWQPFGGDSSSLRPAVDSRRRSMQHTRAASMGGGGDGWDAFSSGDVGLTSSQTSPVGSGFSNLSSFAMASSNTSTSIADNRGTRPGVRSQPAGWAGFN